MIINIFYMHYETGTKSVPKERPNWFNYEACLKNIIYSIENSPGDVKIVFTLMFDGDADSFNENFCSKYFELDKNIQKNNCEYRVKLINAGTGAKSGQITLDYINSKNYGDDELIYTLENDYLHTSNWVANVRDIFNSKIPFDYLTLYDHGDKYEYNHGFSRRYIDLNSKIYACNKIHWRTIPSTCFSFITSPITIKRDAKIFKNFHDMKAFIILRYFKRRRLLSAIPGQSTHCMSDYLAPTIDWADVSKREIG
jgi:hypothetical protein